MLLVRWGLAATSLFGIIQLACGSGVRQANKRARTERIQCMVASQDVSTDASLEYVRSLARGQPRLAGAAEGGG